SRIYEWYKPTQAYIKTTPQLPAARGAMCGRREALWYLPEWCPSTLWLVLFFLFEKDPSLVRGSLRDNLDPTGSHKDEELWQALREAHLAEFVASQPNGLFVEVGDGGSNLSVGQRQLVCLARALIRKPKVLLLDEATSQMDGDTDRLIQTTLRESFAGCTLLTIAHRINTILDYDKILVMGAGRVLEYGPVYQLLADKNSHFNEMATKAGMLTERKSFESKALTTKF
ncbi:unnamed protein product, partial [Ixodes pacificus]